MVWGYHYFRKHPFGNQGSMENYIFTYMNLGNFYGNLGKKNSPVDFLEGNSGRCIINPEAECFGLFSYLRGPSPSQGTRDDPTECFGRFGVRIPVS